MKMFVNKLFGLPVAMVMVAVVCAMAIGVVPTVMAQPALSLGQAVTMAQENDPWLSGSRYRERATEAQSDAAAQLPDPILSLGFANLPVDSFNFNQEPMTQFKLGVSQVFPRGDTRALKRQQLRELSAQQPYMRQDRREKVAVAVSLLWLDTYRSRETIRLIERDRTLFEHLVDVAHSSYTSAVGKTRQQDLLRAQLELTRLDDRLNILQQQQDMASAKLGEWLSPTVTNHLIISDQLPTLHFFHPQINTITGVITNSRVGPEQLLAALLKHPMIRSLDQKIVASSTNIKLAKQKYKPQWGLNASYGYRDNDLQGNDRSDFFSLGVSFDLPLFTANRQDKQLQAAVATEGAIKTDKALALRSMRARAEAAQLRLQRLNQRKVLYRQRLLQELHDQVETSLTAYTNDDGDFSEVIRAHISELNANIDFLNITIDRLKTIVELNYFFNPIATDYVVDVSHAGGVFQ